MLPGAFNTASDFAAARFAEAVSERGLALDLVFAELGFEHVADRSIVQRLSAGPLREARDAGCESVWLGGVSLGAYVALGFAECRPGEVDGLCLLAPYLGTRLVTGELRQAGGVERWDPGVVAAHDEERRLWAFIRSGLPAQLDVWLGYGRGDRFADSQALLARTLPTAAVDCIDGAHDWATWRTLWGHFLDRWPARAAGATNGAHG